MIKDTPIIIMDEATASFDIESDALFYETLNSKFSNKTVIIITHRYEHLKGMDKVYSLNNGKLEKMSKGSTLLNLT